MKNRFLCDCLQKILIVSFFALPAATFAQIIDNKSVSKKDPSKYYFYDGSTYGTQGKYSPGDFFINGGYGVWQFNDSRKIFDFPYDEAFHHTWENMLHPLYAIHQFGVKEWLTSEIVPASFSLKHGQYFPNYFLHSLGAGMQSRKMEEWYDYHNVPFPRIWSITTMMCEHFFEEVIEDGGINGTSVDPVSDMFIFNPLGILLFSNDNICRFFSDKFSLNEWSLQPSINFNNGKLENMGQFYVVKYPLERTNTWGLMLYFGMQGLLGVTRTFDGDKTFSVTGGLIVNNLGAADISKSQKAYTANLRWSAGVFYDVKNSLMMSLVVTGAEHNRFRLNLYPGFVGKSPFSPGIFIDNTGVWAAGFSIRYCPIGAAF